MSEPTKNQLTWSETSIPLPLSRRDYFAAMAMQSMLTAPTIWNDPIVDIPKCAIRYADALIKALDETNGN